MEYKEKKLRSLSKRLEELVDGETPQSIYGNLHVLMKSQQDYFKTFDNLFIVKLVLYIYSYKKTGDFELATKMCNQLFFAKLFKPRDENYQESCNTCGGDGDLECNECYGSGEQQCNNCDGSGEQQCNNCDGSGEIEDVDVEGESIAVPCPDCNSSGEYTCSDCGGEGLETCYECNGNGREPCYECSGTGEQESEELMYDLYSICSWDKDIYNRCEINLNTPNPSFTDDDFYDLRNKYLILHNEEDHGELIEDLSSDNYYCFMLEIDVNDDLDISSSMKIMILGDPYEYIQ